MDRIEIKGVKYPVLICWAAIAEFCESKGLKDLSAIGDLSTMSAKDIQVMMFWCLFFGAIAEKESFPYTQEDLGLAIGPVEVTAFVGAFARQMKSLIPDSEFKLENPTKKKNRSFFGCFRG